MERVPLKQTDRHHKSPGGDLCIRDSSPKGARGLTEYFFDVVISLEAARWALFSCQTNVTIKLRNMTSL
ncbi:hypothetical protein FVA98_15320, partial [Escherichia coli]|nr:hypothetical protein [Escherichia coli]MPV24261.1 hypothetical protein [Escherichia coli]